jgi:uncharacterized protein involved in outer membrane biogenesis
MPHAGNPEESIARKGLRPFLVLTVGLALGLVVFLLTYNSNWLRGPIAHLVEAKTGRSFAIEGDLRVRPGLPTRVHVERVRFGNPDWAVEDQMLELEQADFRIKLFRLLFGEIIIPQAHAIAPVVNLERGAEGRNNWTLGARDDKEGGTVPIIGRVTVDRGRLSFHHTAEKTAIQVSVHTQGSGERDAVAFDASGRLNNIPLTLKGTGGPILSIKDETLPYPLNAAFSIGSVQGSAEGTITGLATLKAVNINLDVKGNSLAGLYPIMGIALPPTPPYRIKGRVIHDDEYWRMHKFTGKVGDSDLAGDVDVLYQDKRARITAKLTSRLLDLDDVGGLIGAPPQTGAGETASAAQKQQTAALAAKPKMLPDEPYKLDRLRAMDADIHFTGHELRNSKLPISAVQVHAVLEQGVLKADPLKLELAGGTVSGSLRADARKKPLTVESDLRFRRVQLALLYPESELLRASAGTIGGRAVLKGRGDSFADVLAHSDGTLGFAMRGGRVGNLLLEFTGLDVAEVVKFLFAGDRTVEVNCAVADFDVKQGIMQTRSVVIDTSDTNIYLEGQISLRDETLDLTLHPLPKDWSPLTLRSPLHLRGSFKNPDIDPDKKLLLRGGLAAVLAVVAGPLAALLPLIETGPGQNADCQGLINAAKQHARIQAQ